jgi:hypothetical protein
MRATRELRRPSKRVGLTQRFARRARNEIHEDDLDGVCVPLIQASSMTNFWINRVVYSRQSIAQLICSFTGSVLCNSMRNRAAACTTAASRKIGDVVGS